MTERTGRRDKGTTAIDNDRAIFIKERSGNSERSEATERIALLRREEQLRLIQSLQSGERAGMSAVMDITRERVWLTAGERAEMTI